MALILTDGFETYRTLTDILGKWTSITNSNLINDDGYGGSQSLGGGGGTCTLYKNFTADATVIVGWACRTRSITAGTNNLVVSGDSGATTHVTLKFTTAGNIEAYRGTTAGTLLGATTSNPLASYGVNDWVYVEAKVTISDTVGVVEVRLGGNSSPILNLTSQDTKNAGTNVSCDRVTFNWANDNSARWDDFYICTGTTAPNDFLGEVQCYALVPNGNGNSSQLVGSDANSTDNYLLVDETTAVGVSSADYVGSATDGQKDTYAFTNIPTTGTVISATVGIYALKTDAGGKSMRPVIRSGGTDYAGTDQALTTSLARYYQEYLTNPATAAAWTPSEVNSAEFGFEVRP
jgi:hypothetical protein